MKNRLSYQVQMLGSGVLALCVMFSISLSEVALADEEDPPIAAPKKVTASPPSSNASKKALSAPPEKVEKATVPRRNRNASKKTLRKRSERSTAKGRARLVKPEKRERKIERPQDEEIDASQESNAEEKTSNPTLRRRGEAKSRYRSARRKLSALKRNPSASPVEKKAAKKALIKARREFRALNRKRAVRFMKSSPAEKKAFKDRLAAHRAKHREKRQKSSADHRKRLQARIGTRSKKPEVRAEMKRHAWRMARLTRLFDIAEAARRADAKKRAESLMAKERERHEAKLAQLLQASEQTQLKKPAAIDLPPSATEPPTKGEE